MAITRLMAVTRLMTIAGLISITGCQSTVPSQPEVPRQSVPGPTAQQLIRIDNLLSEAERAIQQQRLTTPVDDNAYLRFLQVLSVDPDNLEAEAGISRIVETYLGWASAAIERDELSRATGMLNKANSLDESHPAITSLRQRINSIRQTEKQLFKIAASDLTSRSPELALQLAELAISSEARGAIAKIIAKTDAEARWIYQQMNLATETRLRATIHTGVSSSVQLSFP